MLYSANRSVFKIGSLTVPGVLQSVSDPDREINWQVQQGVAGLGAATIYRGRKLIESLVITTLLRNDADVEAWRAMLATIDPKPTLSPPAWDLDFPTLRLLYPPMGRAAHKKNSIKPLKSGPPVTAYIGVLELIEYRPLKLARPGPPEPAQLDSRDVPPRDAEEQELQELLQKAKGL